MDIDHKVVETPLGYGLAVKIETSEDVIINVLGPYKDADEAEAFFAANKVSIVESAIERAQKEKREKFAEMVIAGAAAQAGADAIVKQVIETMAKPDEPKPNLH